MMESLTEPDPNKSDDELNIVVVSQDVDQFINKQNPSSQKSTVKTS